MANLFKSGSKKTKSTMDPWAVLPASVKKDIKKQSKMATEMQKKAFNEAVNLGKSPREVLEMSGLEGDALDQVLQGAGISAEMGELSREGLMTNPEDYESGYTEDVVDTTLEGMDRNAQREALSRESQNANFGGTSNSRTAVGHAVAEGENVRARSAVEAGLRDDAHRFGVDSSFKGREMADRFATSGLARDAAVGDWMKGFGAEQRGLEQEQIDATRTSKADSLSWLAGIQNGTPNTALGGGVTTGTESTPSMFSQLLGGASAVAGAVGMVSDENAKEDIDYDVPGLAALRGVTPASYRYKADAPVQQEAKKDRTTGLIAQNLTHIEGATNRRPDGLLEVQPYAVLATVVKAVQELDRRTNNSPQAGL